MHMDIGSCSQLRISLVFGVSTWPPHGVGIKMACPNIESTEVYSSDQRTCCPKCLDPPPSHPPPLPALCFHSLWLVVFFSLIYLNRFINDLVSFVNHQQFGVDTSSHTHSRTPSLLQTCNLQINCSALGFLDFLVADSRFNHARILDQLFRVRFLQRNNQQHSLPSGQIKKDAFLNRLPRLIGRCIGSGMFSLSFLPSFVMSQQHPTDLDTPKQRSDANTSQHSPLSTVSLPANPSISSTAATSNSKVPPPPPSSTT